MKPLSLMPRIPRLAPVLKGHDFSRALRMPTETAALAAEEMQLRTSATPLIFGFLLLLLGATAWSQIPAAPARPPRTANPTVQLYRIAGRVVNAVTGEPVREATVAALSTETSHTLQSVRADSEGHFALEGLPAGKYQLTASKRGYRTAFYDEHEGFSSAIVTGQGQDSESLVFRLPPDAELRVTVTDDGGEPVEKAKILVFWRLRNHGQNGRIEQVDQAVTDDDGVWSFSNLAPGEYFVAVTAQPWYAMHKPGLRQGTEAGNAMDVAYPLTFFDGAAEEGRGYAHRAGEWQPRTGRDQPACGSGIASAGADRPCAGWIGSPAGAAPIDLRHASFRRKYGRPLSAADRHSGVCERGAGSL